MMDMPNLQRRLAASILKVGQSKVWMDPEKVKDIEQAITRSDVRKLILKKFVKKLPDKIKMPVGMKKKKAGERGQGRRKGTKNSIVNRKTRWVQTVRPLRRELAAIKKDGMIENEGLPDQTYHSWTYVSPACAPIGVDCCRSTVVAGVGLHAVRRE